MRLKLELRNKQWVKRVLHKPSIKVVRAAARFIKYTGHKLRVSYAHGRKFSGRCQGRFAFKIVPPGTWNPTDHLQAAINFFSTACHELCHCQDNIDWNCFYDDYDKKRPEWRKRAEERAVFDRLYDLTDGTAEHYEHQFWVTQVKLPAYVQNAILELAIAIEEAG